MIIIKASISLQARKKITYMQIPSMVTQQVIMHGMEVAPGTRGSLASSAIIGQITKQIIHLQ